MSINRRLCVFLFLFVGSFLLSSCGGGSSRPPQPTNYSIGGTVSKLAGSGGGLQLQNNGGDTLSVNANGTFTFTTKVASGSRYNVTVSAQPSTPAQTCGVTGGSGTATANVTNITVDCGHNEWTWVNGANVVSQPGVYGTQGTPALGNVPGARAIAASWTDTSGNLWLFGGGGRDSAGADGALNDLWKYSGGEWTWMSGANVINQTGTYGTQGTPAPGNVPGARMGPVSWIDASGNPWLFGGQGFDSAGSSGFLNDLWKYSGGEWTWMSGANVINQAGTYGTQGTPAPGNVPGSRLFSLSWTDAAGDLWLFGGLGYDSAGSQGMLNDLWKYSGGEWTWMSGANVINQAGTYGTQGTPAPGNAPGARTGALGWTDSSGNLWLFGGGGYDSTGSWGYLNDLWKYSGGEWTWMSGANVRNQAASYGTLGTPAPGNDPGSRYIAVAWTDATGDFWLFGGYGLSGKLNDLWKYSGGQWAWMSGPNVVNQAGTYGTQGTPAPGNVPGARVQSLTWADASGNLWLFGGYGIDSAGNVESMNDLWAFEP